MNESVIITYDKTEVKPMWGGHRVESTYFMKHVRYGRVNHYKVTAEIAGLENLDLHFHANTAEFIGNWKDSNDETLTEQGILDLFEDNI